MARDDPALLIGAGLGVGFLLGGGLQRELVAAVGGLLGRNAVGRLAAEFVGPRADPDDAPRP